MKNVIALFGPAGSGKDYLLSKIDLSGFNKVIMYTTRPMREGETNGIEYHFISEKEFQDKIENGEMIEYKVFNNWYYGTSYDSYSDDKINIGIFTIAAINKLKQFSTDFNIEPVYILTNDKIRLIRQLNREENPNVLEICRRFISDNTDFTFVDFAYYVVRNSIDNCNGVIDLTNIINNVEDKINYNKCQNLTT